MDMCVVVLVHITVYPFTATPLFRDVRKHCRRRISAIVASRIRTWERIAVPPFISNFDVLDIIIIIIIIVIATRRI